MVRARTTEEIWGKESRITAEPKLRTTEEVWGDEPQTTEKLWGKTPPPSIEEPTPRVEHLMPSGEVMPGTEHPGAVPGTTRPSPLARAKEWLMWRPEYMEEKPPRKPWELREAEAVGKMWKKGLEYWHRASTATLSALEAQAVSAAKPWAKKPILPALRSGWRLEVPEAELSESLVTAMGLPTTEKIGFLPTAQRLGKEFSRAWYETWGTDPVIFAWNIKTLSAARKIALFNKVVNIAGKKGAKIITTARPEISPRVAEKVSRALARNAMGRQMEIAKVNLRDVKASELKNIIRTLKTIKPTPLAPRIAPPIPPTKAIVPAVRPPVPPITPPVVPPITPPITPIARPPITPPVVPPEVARPPIVPAEKIIPKGIEPTIAFETREFKSLREFKNKGDFLEYIKPKLKEVPNPYVEGSKTVRPFVVGYGCDGTTDANIHYVAQKMTKALGLDYAEIYNKAYPDKRGEGWIHKDLGELKDEALKTKKVKDITVIPKNATIQDVLDDLYDVNNRSLVEELESTFEKNNIPLDTKLGELKIKPEVKPTITPPGKAVRVFEPQPLKPAFVKKQVREVAGMIKPVKPVSERIALREAYRKAQKAYKEAFRLGKTQEARKYKNYQRVLVYAMRQRTGLSASQIDTLKKVYIQGKPDAIEKLTTLEAETLKGIINKVGIKIGIRRPVIPREKRVTTKGFFAGMQFRKPTAMQWVTPQSYYAQQLGVKPLVEGLEAGKRTFDLTYRNSVNEVFKQGKIIEKLGKTTAKERIQARLKNIPTKAIERMRNLLDAYEEAPDFLMPQEKEVFNWFRNLNRTILTETNKVRVKLGEEPIRYRKAYVRHTAEGMAREMLMGKYPFPQELSYWSKKVVGKRIFNPMELHRQLADDLEEIWTKDLIHATQSMLRIGLKEIHLSQPLKFFNEQLGAVAKDPSIYRNLSPEEKTIYDQTHTMPESTRRWVTDYVNQAIKGQETEWDASINRIVTEGGLKAVFDKLLAPFGRSLGRKPITHLFQTTGRLTIHGVMGPLRPKQLIRNKFQLTQNLAIYGFEACLRSFYPATKQIKELMSKSLWLKGYTGFEELPTNIQGKLEKLNLAFFQWTALTNAQQAMKAAYWDTLDLIERPKYKKFGWADPKRTYKEPEEFLYASEKEKIFKEMEFGANVTQYGYTPLDMPQIFRHKTLIPFTRLQSWWMNHFFKFNREAMYRAFKGETSYGTKLPWSRRIGWFRYLIFGGLLLNTLGYYRSYLFGAAPTGLPPVGQLMLAMYTYAINTPADTTWKKRKKAEAERRMFTSVKTFIPGYYAWRDFRAMMSGEKPLREYFFYKKWEKEKVKKVPF